MPPGSLGAGAAGAYRGVFLGKTAAAVGDEPRNAEFHGIPSGKLT